MTENKPPVECNVCPLQNLRVSENWSKFLKIMSIFTPLITTLVLGVATLGLAMDRRLIVLEKTSFTREDGVSLLEKLTLLDKSTSKANGDILVKLETIKQLIPKEGANAILIDKLNRIELRIESLEKK